MMPETVPVVEEKVWKMFLRRHWKMVVALAVGLIIVVAGALYIFLWFVKDAQVTNLVPSVLGLWSMSHVVWFIIYLILWEILFIGIPLIIAAILLYYLWWKKFPGEEREEYRRRKLMGKRSRRSRGEGAFNFLIFLGFVIKVYVDGNWNVPFATWTFDYLASSSLVSP